MSNTPVVEVVEEEVVTDPRFLISSKKDFNKGPSLVFLLHHYGQSLSDARYKTERLIAGESINATLPDVTTVDEFYSDLKKIGLEAELINKETFFISR